MSTVLGYCKYCRTHNEKYRIFPVNTSAAVCYCPRCMTEMNPQDAVQELNDNLKLKMIDANKIMWSYNDYEQAYYAYGDILELEPDYYLARFGRLLALLCMSKLRKSTFGAFYTMFKEESVKKFRYKKMLPNYVLFLKLADSILDEYLEKALKSLSIKGYFYSSDCVMLYITRIKEIISVKELIQREIKASDNGEKNDITYLSLANKVNESIDNLNARLAQPFILADGITYHLVDCLKDGTPVLGTDNVKAQTSVGKYVYGTLGKKDRKQRIISDIIYPDNTRISKKIKETLPAIIIFALFTLLFAGLFTANTILNLVEIPFVGNIPFIVLGVITLGISILEIILRITWFRRLRGPIFYRENYFVFK